jgi:outer membrane autotransporter protein
LQISADNNLGAAGTTLTLNGGTLATTATFNSSRPIAITANNGGIDVADGTTLTWNGAISGPGALNKFGAGTLLFNGNQSYAGATNVLAGTLAVGDPSHTSANLSGSSLVTVASGAALGGYGTVAGNVVNNGTIAVANAVSAFSNGPTGTFTISGNVTNSGLINLAGSTPGNVLKIGGNYTGTAGSTVQFNTVLNAGGPLSNQFTDRLLITGSADPSTVTLHTSGSGSFTSTGLPTNTSGISIIQVAGSSYAGAFTLAGGYITGGTPYQYHLNAYGPGSPNGAAASSQNLVGNSGGYWDFRLQNAFVTPSGPAQPGQPIDPTTTRPALAPQVPAYITAPTALFSAGLQDIDQLHRRLGEIRDAQAKGLPQTAEFFARGYGNTMTYKSNRSFADYGISASESYAAFQLGGSAVVTNDDFGMLRLGLAGSYGKLQFDPNAPDGFSEGNVNVGKVSGIATFQARAGWYLDGIVSGGWFNGTVGTAARGQAATLSGSMVGASLEGGYPIGLGWQKLSVEPQVQVSWQHLMFDDTTDVDSINTKLGMLDQGIVRAGARLVRPFETDDGRFVTPYVKANLLQGFADNNNAINVGGVAFDTGQYGTAIQVGGGVTGMLMANLAVYGDVSYQHEVSDGGFRGWAFNGGVRYQF